jgi:hypothetical protein
MTFRVREDISWTSYFKKINYIVTITVIRNSITGKATLKPGSEDWVFKKDTKTLETS